MNDFNLTRFREIVKSVFGAAILATTIYLVLFGRIDPDKWFYVALAALGGWFVIDGLFLRPAERNGNSAPK